MILKLKIEILFGFCGIYTDITLAHKLAPFSSFNGPPVVGKLNRLQAGSFSSFNGPPVVGKLNRLGYNGNKRSCCCPGLIRTTLVCKTYVIMFGQRQVCIASGN